MSHTEPTENILGAILEFALTYGLDHSPDKTVDVVASIAKLSAISRRPSCASFEAPFRRVKSEPRLHACQPEVFDADLSSDDRLGKVPDTFFLEEESSELIVEFHVSVSLSPLPQKRL